MISILREIAEIRQGRPFVIDRKNSNRYCVIMQENDGTETGYCFSTPIYNIHTRRVVDLKFSKKEKAAYAIGSNANISVSDTIRLENEQGCCILQTDKTLTRISERELKYGHDVLLPTTNGIAYKAHCKGADAISIDLEVKTPFMQIRANDRYFSLMSEKFIPFLTVSCIGTLDSSGKVIAPAMISYQKINDRRYRLTFTPCNFLGEWLMFECNLYEPKLFQDTTVESRHPTVNNAFGGTGFIGNTVQFGEQWLYSRPDLAKLSELMDKRINRAVLHLPTYSHSPIELSAFKMSARFCSFGSTWDNKIEPTDMISYTKMGGHYHDLDVTAFLIDTKTGSMIRSEGFILRSRVKGSGFSAIATGDSCYTPQILEIHFR